MTDDQARFLGPPRHQPGEYVMTTVRPMTWMEKHLSVIVTIAILSVGGAVTWGRMLTGFDNFNDRLLLVETVLRGTSFVEGPAIDAEQNRRIAQLEQGFAALTTIIADMRAYDARMEERLAGLTTSLSRIEIGIEKLAEEIASFSRYAVP